MKNVGTLISIVLTLSLSFHSAFAYAEADEAASCELALLTPSQASNRVSDLLLEYRSELSLSKKLLVLLYSKSIKGAVLKHCLEQEECTELTLMQSILDVSADAFNHARKAQGIAKLAGLWSIGVGVVVTLGKLTSNPAISVLGANEVAGFTNIAREPIDLLWKPKIKQKVYFF